MESSRQNLRDPQTPNSPNLKIAADLILSMTAVPLLLGLCAAKAGSQFLQTLGSDSEEVFRGDRLPLLNFPHPEAPKSNR
ncbi:MAG: hypothetical protein ACM37W_27555 [Actinomycetota bacterium]